jgi:hypothetical protein
MYQPGRDPVSEGYMGLEAKFVTNLRIRRNLRTPFLLCPILGVFHKGRPDALSPGIVFDKPALKIADVIGFAIFDKRPNADFEKSDERSVAFVRDNYALCVRMLDNIHHLVAMVVLRGFVPQHFSQSKPLAQIAFTQGTYAPIDWFHS